MHTRPFVRPLAWLAASLALLAGLVMIVTSNTRIAGAITHDPVYAWGSNGDGELGVGTAGGPQECGDPFLESCSTTPVVVSMPARVNATAIAAGGGAAYAIGSDGNLYAWGNNDYGQLGVGTTTFSTTPVVVSMPAGVNATAIAVGSSAVYAIGSDGNLYAWGDNGNGQLGDGSPTGPQTCSDDNLDSVPCSTTPVVVSMPARVNATAIAAGGGAAYAIGSDGNLYAWGDGVLGDGAESGPQTCYTGPPIPVEAGPCQTTPVVVSMPAGVSATAIAASSNTGYAIGSDGNLYAWGANFDGQLGDGTTTGPQSCIAEGVFCSPTPALVSMPPGVSATVIAASSNTAYAIGSDGNLYAWGANFDGQLGDGTTTGPQTCSYLTVLPCNPTPAVVSMPPGVSATTIVGGFIAAYAIGSDGNLYAWGDNDYGELGDGTTTGPQTCDGDGAYGNTPVYCSTTPVVVSMPTGASATAISSDTESESMYAIGTQGEAPPTTLSTSLSGGGYSGTSISVPIGTAVTDAASLSGTNASIGTRTVTYDVYSDSDCSTPVTGGVGDAEPITTPGTLPSSVPVTIGTPGTYYWQATYSGDVNNASSVSICGSEVETVTLPTTLSTSLSGGGYSGTTILVSITAVTDTATLSGTNASIATGTVTYDVYSDSDCSTLATGGTGSPEPITTPGTLPASAPVTLSPGIYDWQATYSGDANNAPSVSPCGSEVETVIPPQLTTLSTSLSAGGYSGTIISVPIGTAVTDSATLSGTYASTATGTVTYDVYSDSDCSTLATGGTGSAEPITTPGTLPVSAPVTLSPGTYYWQVTYSGDADNTSSTTTCGSEIEGEAPPTALSTSLSGGGSSGTSISVPIGTAVADRATLSGTDASVATGTVTYDVYSNSTCTTSVSTGNPKTITTAGTLPASAPVTLSTPGTYYWQATYSGDVGYYDYDDNAPSVSPCGSEVETVIPPTTLSTSLSGGGNSSTPISVPIGTAVTDTATVTGTNASIATGTVTYDVYSSSTCKTAVSTGAPEMITTPGTLPASPPVTLSLGTYYWQASYSGDADNASSVSPCGSEIETVTNPPYWSINTSSTEEKAVGNLTGVSCLSSSACTADGWGIDPHTGFEDIGILTSFPNSPDNLAGVGNPEPGKFDNQLNGISCVSISFCMDVGWKGVLDGSAPDVPQTLIVTLSGRSWSTIPSPDVLVDSSMTKNELQGVSCVSATSCIAVGYYLDDDPSVAAWQTLIESWNGIGWSIVPSPNNLPPYSPGTHADASNFLNGVSCVSAKRCVAVGNILVSRLGAISYDTLIESWNGTTWSVIRTPNVGTTEPETLNGVSCISSTRCVAVGYADQGSGGQSQTLIDSLSGSVWSVDSSRDRTAPNGAMLPNYLNGVSCVSTGVCQAVGYYADSTNDGFSYTNQTLIESLTPSSSGTAWGILPSPNYGPDGGTDTPNELQGVSCVPSVTPNRDDPCSAVGYWVSDTYQHEGLVESWPSIPTNYFGPVPDADLHCNATVTVTFWPRRSVAGGPTGPAEIEGHLLSCSPADSAITITGGTLTGSFTRSPFSCSTLTSTGAPANLSVKWTGDVNGSPGDNLFGSNFVGTASFTASTMTASAEQLVTNAHGDVGFSLPGSGGTSNIAGSYGSGSWSMSVYSASTTSPFSYPCHQGVGAYQLTFTGPIEIGIGS